MTTQPPLDFISKLPDTAVSIFSVMSQLAHQHQAVNLSQGFPDFAVDSRLMDLVTQHMKEGANQYAPMPGSILLRERIAQKYEHLKNLTFNPDSEITITAGGTQGLFTAIGTLISPGDEVIILEPAYDSYKPSVEAFGGKVIPIQLLAPDFKMDWAYVKSQITDRTKAIIMNNPNNPTATVMTAEDMEALESILIQYRGLYVISDEVYEHIIFDHRIHHSVLDSEILRSRSFVVASFGKLLHATGWKIGYVVAPPFLTSEFRKIHQFNVFSVNTPVQLAIADFLSDTDYYLTLSSFFQDKRDYLAQALEQTPFKVLPSAGTYFMLLDYSDISQKSELDFAKELTEKVKVAMIPISAFYSEGMNQRLLRICFAKKEETLDRAIGNLLKI